ncbi:MAG: GWxTD domain-containing protein [bacterium]
MHKQAGEFQEALDAWFQGYRQALEDSADIRIGIAFIELVTEEQAHEYYEIASKMYLDEFSARSTRFHQAVHDEMDRLSPIAGRTTYKEWLALWERNDTSLNREIVHFWKQKDPTPSTEINERLLEHWERIAYARKKFRKRRNTVYGTDDRGLIYVKFGKPDRSKFGSLGGNRAALKRWSNVILSSSEDINVRAGSTQIAEQSFLVEQIDRYNNVPDYEIWFYDSFDTEVPVFFLFGNREGIGAFGLRQSIEEFIPGRAFLSTSSLFTKGIIPGAVLQSLYYSELVQLHPYFEDRFQDLETIWDNLESRGVGAMVRTNRSLRIKRRQFESIDRTNPIQRSAPNEQSDFAEVVSPIDLVVQPFRFLDNHQTPRLALVTFSYPKIKTVFLNTNAAVRQSLTIAHTLVAHDKNGRELERSIIEIPSGHGSFSTFYVDHNENQADFWIYAEAFSQVSFPADDNGKAGEQSEPGVIGVGKTRITVAEPLSSSNEVLELSDLIVGVRSTEEAGLNLPFPVVPSRRIAQSDILKLYLEIYNLFFDASGMAHLTIAAEASKIEGNEKSKEQSVTLSFDFDSPERTSREDFEIDISKLTPGNYELSVHVFDKVSQQNKQRVVRFEITGESR